MADDASFDMQDQELLHVFLEEAREQIDTLDQGLLRLEREPDNVELIQAIFRAAHTLKGSSAVMGLKRMANLTHAMEDVLDRVRDKALEVSSEVGDALLRGLDLLREMEADVEAGKGDDNLGDDVTEAASILRVLAKGEAGGGKAKAKKSAALKALPDDTFAVLVNFVEDCQMPSIRAYMVLRELERMGEIIECQPSREEIDNDKVERRLLVVIRCSESEDNIRSAVMSVAEVEWARLARGAAAAGLRLDLPAREDPERQAEQRAERRSAGQPTQSVANQQTIRVDVETLDQIMNLVGELVLDRTRLTQLKEELSEHFPDEEFIRDLDTVTHHLGSIVGELHEGIMEARMLPVSHLFNRFPRLVRDLSRNLGKEVEFHVEGESEKLDRSVIEKLVDPLTHLLRNSLDHGMELPAEREAQGKMRCGSIILSARRKEEHVLIQVSDDGPGINLERLKQKAIDSGVVSADRARQMTAQDAYQLIFASGLSTAAQVSDVSGRGVGMDVVKRNVESLGGGISVESQPGCGTTITLKIPLTLAIISALIVKVGNVAMALPLSLVEETIKVNARHLQTVRGRALLKWRDTVVPVVRMAEALHGCEEAQGFMQEDLHVVAVRYNNRVVCLAVESIIGHQEIVVKPLGVFLGEIMGLAGATILGNGRVALIVDVGKLFESGLLQEAAAQGILVEEELALSA